MSFFTGLIIGVAVGVVLIVIYARTENARSRRRSDLVSHCPFSLPSLFSSVLFCSFEYDHVYIYVYMYII